MKFSDVLRRSGRNLRQAKARTLLTALALAVGGFTLTITLAGANGAKAYSARLVNANLDPSSLIVVKDKSLLSSNGAPDSTPMEYDDSLTSLGAQSALVKELSESDAAKIRAIPGVDDVLVFYAANPQFVTGPNDKRYTVRTKSYDPRITHNFLAGNLHGDVPPGSVLLPNDYVRLLGFTSARDAVGQTVTMQLRRLTGETEKRQFRVAAVWQAPATLVDITGKDDMLLSQADAQSVYGYINAGTTNAGRFISLTAHIADGTDKATLDAAKQRINRAGYAALSAQDTQALISQIINVLQIIIIVFGIITLVASFFGVVNTQYISVLERTSEIGLMKALGMSRSVVNKLFVLEATWIGFLGAVLGSGGAILVGLLINPWLSRKLNFGKDHLLIFKPWQIIGLIIFLMLITTLAGLLPARKAAKLDPIEALRAE